MTQDQVERFLAECQTKGISITKTNRALLECFRHWVAYDTLVKETEKRTVAYGQN